MKIKVKKPLNAESVKASNIPSGNPSGNKSADSNVEKAQKIIDLGYSKRSQSTLERLSKEELEFILKNKRDPEKDELSKDSLDASKEIVSGYIQVCEAVKSARCDEPLNKTFIKICQAQDKALCELVGASAKGKTALILLSIAMIALLIDACIGFDVIKERFAKKKINNETTNKPNTQGKDYGKAA